MAINKCVNGTCHLRHTCYKFMVKPAEQQVHVRWGPDENGNCWNFWSASVAGLDPMFGTGEEADEYAAKHRFA